MTVESNYAIAIAIHLVIGLKDLRQFALLINYHWGHDDCVWKDILCTLPNANMKSPNLRVL